MANVYLNIDSSAIVKHVNRLEKMRKYALPNAIRGTLTKAARHVKQNTLPVSAKKHFITRNNTFFKANSRFEKATGSDVKSMKAIVGFTPNNIKHNVFSVPELEEQEYSGKIPKRTLIPYRWARKGNTNAGQVLTRYRIKTVRNKLVDSTKGKGPKAGRFIRAAFKAGRGGFVLGNYNKPSVYAITGLRKEKGRPIVTKIPIYSFRQGRSARIKTATGFMREATNNSARNLDKFFIEESQRQYDRIK